MNEASDYYLDVTRDELTSEIKDRIHDVGPFQFDDDESNFIVWVRMPAVKTQGERDLHISRLNSIQGDIFRVRNHKRIIARQQMEREARANLRRFSTCR